MRILALTTCVLLGGCQNVTAQDDEGPFCVVERFELTRDERRRGIILSRGMTNIDFGKEYSRRELIARYRIYRGNSGQIEPTAEDLSVAESLISQRSKGVYDPQEIVRAAPCMYVEIIPAEA